MTIITTPQFAKDFKQLAKKYPSLTADLRLLQTNLLENPTQGTPIGDAHSSKIGTPAPPFGLGLVVGFGRV